VTGSDPSIFKISALPGVVASETDATISRALPPLEITYDP
jgi:hypothetical protein